MGLAFPRAVFKSFLPLAAACAAAAVTAGATLAIPGVWGAAGVAGLAVAVGIWATHRRFEQQIGRVLPGAQDLSDLRTALAAQTARANCATAALADREAVLQGAGTLLVQIDGEGGVLWISPGLAALGDDLAEAVSPSDWQRAQQIEIAGKPLRAARHALSNGHIVVALHADVQVTRQAEQGVALMEGLALVQAESDGTVQSVSAAASTKAPTLAVAQGVRLHTVLGVASLPGPGQSQAVDHAGKALILTGLPTPDGQQFLLLPAPKAVDSGRAEREIAEAVAAARDRIVSSMEAAMRGKGGTFAAEDTVTAARLEAVIRKLSAPAVATAELAADLRLEASDLSAALQEMRKGAVDGDPMTKVNATLASMSARLDETAQVVQTANGTAAAARTDAEQAGSVVRAAIDSMARIEEGSEEISNIITVIDDIAFQTNLLALNAGVEAARAGEAGRGFAVVASEVRALAQRSSAAAQEINDLISASTDQIVRGVGLVRETGVALSGIVDAIRELDTQVGQCLDGNKDQVKALCAAQGDLQAARTLDEERRGGTDKMLVSVEKMESLCRQVLRASGIKVRTEHVRVAKPPKAAPHAAPLEVAAMDKQTPSAAGTVPFDEAPPKSDEKQIPKPVSRKAAPPQPAAIAATVTASDLTIDDVPAIGFEADASGGWEDF